MSSDLAIEKRMDRFEQKLDHISTVLTTLARIEERQEQSRSMHRVLFDNFDGLSLRVVKLESGQTSNSGKLGFIERLWWIACAVAAAAAAGMAR